MASPSTPLSSDRQLDRLLEISRILSSTLDLPPLLQSIVDLACELTDSQAASILLYHAEADELRFEAATGLQRESMMEISVPLDSSVAGWIFGNALPLVIKDAESDKRVFREVDRALKFKTMSILGVPLMVKQEPIGVIEAVNKLNDRHYTEEDLAVLEALAAQAAIAIENAQLLSQLKEANAELTRLDRMKSDFIAIASHELRTPLGLILGHATFIQDFVPPKYGEQMEVIIRSALRLKEIIEDMSAIAHRDQGQSKVRRATFSVSDLIGQVASRFMAGAQAKKIELSFDVPEGDPLQVEGDQEKIDVVLTNLVRNALGVHRRGRPSGGQSRVVGRLCPGIRSGHRHRHPSHRDRARLRALLPGRIASDPQARRDGAGSVDRQGDGRDAQRPDLVRKQRGGGQPVLLHAADQRAPG